MNTSDVETDDEQAPIQEPEKPDLVDEKEQLLQRRLARIEEALGLSPLT
ncbi:MAG: hypothetical protein RSG92_26900 [Pseudomonas sp.]